MDDAMMDNFRRELGKAAGLLQDGIPGAHVTLIVRYPSHPDAFAVAGADDLDAVADVIRRAKLRAVQ